MEFLSSGSRTVVARQGEKGALVTTPQESFQTPAFQAKVVDTLGAGDAFDGGFVAARIAGLGDVDAVRWGHAAAAYNIGQPGARGLPNINELKHILGG